MKRKRRGGGIGGLGLAGLVVLGTVVVLPVYLPRTSSNITVTAARQPRVVTARKSKRRSLSGTAIDPSLFVKGSCVAFPPISGNRHTTVFLDAGHGGIDPGGIGETESGQTIYEADETLPVELDAMALLRADGYRVVVSRTGNSSVARPGPGDVSDGIFTVQGEHDEVAARDVCANLAKANILIGIYFDVGGTTQDAGSVTAYDADRPFSTASLRLATLVQNEVVAEMNAQGWNIPNDNVQSDASLGGPPLSSAAAAYGHLLLLGPAMAGFFSTPSEMPGALIEPLFITDPYEGSIAASPPGQQVIANGLAKAVGQYFSISPLPSTSTSTSTAVAGT
jgi:N-acetylmuramoyl-L-alanine amidase